MKNTFKRYLVKKRLEKYFNNKFYVRSSLNRRYITNDKLFIKKQFIYYPVFWKINKNFYATIQYNAYQNYFSWIKRKFNNIKYHKLIVKIKEENSKFRNKKPFLFKSLSFYRLNSIINFLYLYNYFFYSIYIDLFYFTRFSRKKKKQLLYFLILSFKKNKLFINLKNFYKKNYMSISSGLFIKFFEKKKSFKKNKTIKLLMAKYIRKIFLISRIKNTILIVKKNPVFLMEIINLFNSPIAHKFIDPVENRTIEETNNNFIWIKFLYFIFLENKNFSNNKLPQKGRIKRKILRKVVFENKIID